MEEKRELLDRMLAWLEHHEIKSLIEIVLEAINTHEDGKEDT